MPGRCLLFASTEMSVHRHASAIDQPDIVRTAAFANLKVHQSDHVLIGLAILCGMLL
jgi:hypothetical protein